MHVQRVTKATVAGAVAAACLLLPVASVAGQSQRWSESPETKNWSAQSKTEERSAPVAPVGSSSRTGLPRLLAASDKVLVAWTGAWYNATVLEVGDGTYKVHYDGWGSEWDEWVTPPRMRTIDGASVAAAVVPASPQPVQHPTPDTSPRISERSVASPVQPVSPPGREPQLWSMSPVGRWGCRTWDYGQVNRVGEFVLKANGSYEDLMYKGNGRYRYDRNSSRIIFTSGPQKTDYPISFNPEGHEGKGHIIFDYGGGARLDCYREALE